MSPSVVLVEPRPVAREGLALLLRARGFTVVGEAADAGEAAGVLARERPDVALVALAEDDSEALALAAAAPVLFYADGAEPALLHRALDAGAAGYALRDAPADELFEALRRTARGGTYVDPRLRDAAGAARPAPPAARLSRRETQVLGLLACGLTGEQVAERLVISAETVKTHIRNAMGKLDAATRAHAIALALRDGHIEGPSRPG